LHILSSSSWRGEVKTRDCEQDGGKRPPNLIFSYFLHECNFDLLTFNMFPSKFTKFVVWHSRREVTDDLLWCRSSRRRSSVLIPSALSDLHPHAESNCFYISILSRFSLLTVLLKCIRFCCSPSEWTTNHISAAVFFAEMHLHLFIVDGNYTLYYMFILTNGPKDGRG
jgi:hypothetical protein